MANIPQTEDIEMDDRDEGKPINMRIPEDLHMSAKSAAALSGKTLKEFTIEALRLAVRTHKELANAR